MSTNLCIWCIILCAERKPNCESDRILFVEIQSNSFLNTRLFNSLSRKGNRLIGLYEEGRSGGLSGLGIRIIFENFYRSGKYERRKVALNK